MALPPQKEDAFFREVDEELRRDQLGNVWRRYGLILLGLVVLGLAAFGGYLWWQAERHKSIGLASEQLTAALDQLAEGKTAQAEAALATMSNDKHVGYRAIAKLALAARKLENGDNAGASAAYAEVAADTALAQPFRDLALIRGTSAVFDTLKPETVIERLKPLAVAGNPWFGSAAEMTAVAWLKLNKPEKAGVIFKAITQDPQVPDSIRARAVRVAGALGVDAAVAPAAPRKE